MPFPLALAATPLLLAAAPPPKNPSIPSTLLPAPDSRLVEDSSSVETFDPIARAELLTRKMPRLWKGSYRAFDGSSAVPVELQLDAVAAQGQMVTLRGRMAIDGVSSPVQGNLNAKSDQLDLLLLGNRLGAALEAGGEFQGLQGLSLSGWQPPRLTSLGGRLNLVPQASSVPAASDGSGGTVRGLW